MNIGETVSKAIKENKWLNISYFNKENATTYYWIAIKDIDFRAKTLFVTMFNSNRSLETFETWISFERIKTASVIDFSTYDCSDRFIDKIEGNLDRCKWLCYDKFDHNVLNYYQECNYLDCDPYQKDYTPIEGIDLRILQKDKKIALNDNQVKKIVSDIYKYDIRNSKNSYSTLAVNCLSVDEGKKKYIVAYYALTFNPERKELILDKTLRFNKFFLIEGRKHSLINYIYMSVDEFIENFTNDINNSFEIIRSNLRAGEIIDTRPDMMLIERDSVVCLSDIYDGIAQKYYNNELTTPLKSFFGNITRRNNIRKKEPSLILYDKRININQMRVLYNSLKYPVTFVQGPPGTGKTQTIINVVLSAFYNDKKTLICSSNNKPVDGITDLLKLKYDGEIINFPYLRLGRFAEVKTATLKIKKLYEYSTDNIPKDALLNKIKGMNDDRNQQLIELLNIQEKRVDIENCLESSDKLIASFHDKNGKLIDTIKEKVRRLKMDLSMLPEISNEKIVALFNPLTENRQLSQFLFFKSIQYIQKLKRPRYKVLIEICSIQNDDDRVREFNSWTQNDDNMRLLTDVFPVLFSTNISTHRLGQTDFGFDLVVMDEAGQCNVSTALIPISKAQSLLLVGDPNQLKPVTVLEDEVNDALKVKYHVPEKYDYKTHSVLDVMIENDNISKYILLKYHYRCGKKIIDFSNQRYYNNALNLQYIKDEGRLEVIDVKNQNMKQKNEAYEEAQAVVEYIDRNKISDAYIITPFVNQKELIDRMLLAKGMQEVKCGTIHSIQGAEKDTIIFSAAISSKTSKNTFQWIKSNSELINVAVTRAKNKLVIAADTAVIDCLSDKTDDLYNLIQYAKNNGNIVVPQNESVKIEIGKSNGSKAEDEFFATISHFCSCYKTFDAERNVKVRKLFKNGFFYTDADAESEFDLVLYKKTLFTKSPVLVFEVNGGEHLGMIDRENSDKRKMEICGKNGVKLVFIPNSFVKSYEYIADVIFSAKNPATSIQQSLFDEPEFAGFVNKSE